MIPAFNTPAKPDCKLVAAIHRHHDGYVSVHRKDDAGDLRSVCSLPAATASLPGLFDQLHEDLESDGFFSVNGMFRGGFGANRRGYLDHAGNRLPTAYRKSEAVRWLTSCYVDLDCHALGMEPGTVIGEVIRLQDAGAIPPASLITRSGRGVWLFWLLGDSEKPVRAHDSTVVQWSRVQSAILARFSQFGSDANATDAARVTRIPGSINAKAGVRVGYWLQLDDLGNAFCYPLESLAAWFGVDLAIKPMRAIPETGGERTAYQVRAAKGWRGRWAKALENFRRLWQLRGTFKAGTRNSAVLTLATILHFLSLPEGEIAEELAELFQSLDQPPGDTYSRDQFAATVQKAARPRLANRNTRNQTFSDWLHITPEEAELLPGWPPARCFQPPAEPNERLSRTERAARRQLLLAEVMRDRRIGFRGFPTLAELVELVEQAGLGRPAAETVRSDLKAIGYGDANTRKRRPRKADSRSLFPVDSEGAGSQFPETS